MEQDDATLFCAFFADITIKCRQPAVIMVHLPFDQHCKVALQSGCTVIEKIGQKLSKRLVPPEACKVKEKRKSGEERTISWHEDLSKLHSDSELAVILLHPEKNVQHKLIQESNVFMPYAICEVCEKRIYRRWFRCESCNIKFHSKCGSKISTYCRLAVSYFPNSPISNNRLLFSNDRHSFTGMPKPKLREDYCNNRIKHLPKSNIGNDVVNLELNPSLVKKNCQVDEGSFGYVYRGEIYHAGKVAIKESNDRCTVESDEALENEYKILRLVRHANVLMLKGFLNEPRALVTQWCDNLSLYQYLHVNEPPTSFSVCESINISKQIAQGMNYLHSLDILHRDLKSKNIFLTDDMTVKIGDFGHAVYSPGNCSPSRNLTRPVGSLLWMAPEVIRNEGDSIHSDVYSCGIVFYEIAASRLPYSENCQEISTNTGDHKENSVRQRSNLNEFQILLMVGRGLLKPDMKHCRYDFPKLFKSLINKCIQFNKKDRPDFKTILSLLNDIHLPKMHRSTSYVFASENHGSVNDLIAKMKKESLQFDDRSASIFRNSR